MFRRGGRLRAVRPGTVDAALDLALRDPVTNALGGARLRETARSASLAQEFSLVGDDRLPEGVLWHGVNLSPLSSTPRALDEFGAHLAGRPRRASSVVGERAAIERLWETLGRSWDREVREHRWSQPLLLADPPALMPSLPGAGLRAAEPQDAAAVFPAAVAMFREEVGIDPLLGDGGRSYRHRVGELIRQRRTYAVVEEGEVLFKADVGALFGPVAQIHGVWVRPDRRGHGLGRTAMAELVAQVRRDHAPQVSLYVNDFNEPARRAYTASGFRQVGELTTLLF